MKKIYMYFLLCLMPALAFADMDGSYELSLKEYPEITKFLNIGLNEGDYASLYWGQENVNINIINEKAGLFLIDYVEFNNVATNFNTTVALKKDGIYSKVDVPWLEKAEINGSTYNIYSPFAREISQKNNIVVVTYPVTCKVPSEFVHSFDNNGGCDNGEVFQVTAYYLFKTEKLIVSSMDVVKI